MYSITYLLPYINFHFRCLNIILYMKEILQFNGIDCFSNNKIQNN